MGYGSGNKNMFIFLPLPPIWEEANLLSFCHVSSLCSNPLDSDHVKPYEVYYSCSSRIAYWFQYPGYTVSMLMIFTERVLQCHHPGLAPSPQLLSLCPPHWGKPGGGMYYHWLMSWYDLQRHTVNLRVLNVFEFCTHGLQDKYCATANPWSPLVALWSCT